MGPHFRAPLQGPRGGLVLRPLKGVLSLSMLQNCVIRNFVKNSGVSLVTSLTRGVKRNFGAQKSRSYVIVKIAVSRCSVSSG